MAKLEGFHDSAVNVGNARVLGGDRRDWKEKRPVWFRRCHDTKKLIWPLSKAYRSTKVNVKMANQMKIEIEVDANTRWLSPSAYTYRVLTKSQE